MARTVLPTFLKESAEEEIKKCQEVALNRGFTGLDIPRFVRMVLYKHRAIAREWEGLLWRGKGIKVESSEKAPGEAADRIEKSVILSIRPSHFLALGFLGIDGQSCIRTYSGTGCHKHRMASVPTSFIILGYRTDDQRKRELYAPMSRAWGYAGKDGVTVSNFYGLQYRVLRHAVAETCQEAFGFKSLKVPAEAEGIGQTKIPARDRKFYANSDSTFLEAKEGIFVKCFGQ